MAINIKRDKDFSSGPVAKTLSCNAREARSITGQELRSDMSWNNWAHLATTEAHVAQLGSSLWASKKDLTRHN